MKFLTLLFVAILSTTIFIACEFVRPLPGKDVPDTPQTTNTQLAQNALSSLSNTANERALVDLANAASDLSETLAMDDGTSVEPMFSKAAKLADAATILQHAFNKAGCEIELQKFAEASMDAVKAYTIRDAADMEHALQHLTQKALNTERTIQQLPADNTFIPFAFGYGLHIDRPDGHYYLPRIFPDYELGVVLMFYDSTIQTLQETRAAVVEFLTDKGYTPTLKGERFNSEDLCFGATVDPTLLTGELRDILGVTNALPKPLPQPLLAPLLPPPPNIQIADRVRIKYNEAWCQGNFNDIDNILIETSRLDFFDYAFVRQLADIYAEENPETAERIRMNLFSLRSIALEFLEIYFQDSKKTHVEVIELFRQSVRNGDVSIEHATILHYYHWYWNK